QALLISSVFCVLASVFVNVFAKELMGLFIDTSAHGAVVETGIRYLRIEGAFYVGIGVLFLLYGIYRGLAKPGMSVVLTVISFNAVFGDNLKFRPCLQAPSTSIRDLQAFPP
ncbi:MAG: hypothetical protein GX827_07125, partial [Clostridiales bacterium]|nr:hypothetical protein [Clostridiales bacterium]